MKRADGLPSGDVPPQIFVSNIKQILLTTPGERVMRPTFGSNLRAALFSPLPSTILVEALKQEVRRAISTWEPRVGILDIKVSNRDTQVIIKTTVYSPFGPAETEVTFTSS